MSNRSTRQSKQASPHQDPTRPARGASPPPAESTRRRASPPLGGEPNIDALDDLDAPPLHSKVHPSNDISDVVPTLDDEVRGYHHHPNDAGTTEFDVDPGTSDAAADLAGDLGSEFLEGATRGQDMSDVIMSRDEAESELPFLFDTEAVYDTEPGPPDEDAQPTQRITPRRAR